MTNSKTYAINDGTVTVKIVVSADPKREGLLISRHYLKSGDLIGTTWGKKNQDYIKSLIQSGTAIEA